MALQKAQRWLWIAFGYVNLGLGIAGLVLPIMPGVVFLLLAAFCFSRGSDRLHQALLAHPRLGPPIVAWRKHGVIPTRVKIYAVSVMASSVLLTWWLDVPPIALAFHAGFLTIVAIYLVTRPSRVRKPTTVAAPRVSPTPPVAAIPPNQQVTSKGKWPVVGEKAPREDESVWVVEVAGLVDAPQQFTLDALKAFGEQDFVVDIHCVTRWSKPASKFRGVALEKLLDACRPHDDAQFVSFVARSDREHSTSLPLADAIALGAIVAFDHDGASLETIHGGPVRMVVPGRYFYKSIKWLERIELLAVDRLGYWEAEAGYHNDADPWQEQRYAVTNFDRRMVAQLFQTRDFSNRDLRSLVADRMDFAGLNARGAALRDASFRGANLAGACFDGANLSNAHLQGADLANATFGVFDGQSADLEGADFRGADLRGALLAGASLFGATFVTPGGSTDGAIIDASTRIDGLALESLDATLEQRRYIEQAIGAARDT